MKAGLAYPVTLENNPKVDEGDFVWLSAYIYYVNMFSAPFSKLN